MYGAETIRAAIGTDLEGLTVANGHSFNVSTVDVTGEGDPGLLPTPAIQMLAVEGISNPYGTRTGGASMGINMETVAYALDLFLHDGEFQTLERAAADVRNRIERVGSTVRTTAPVGFKDIRITGWEFLEGPDVRRTALHRIRIRIQVDRVFNLGDA